MWAKCRQMSLCVGEVDDYQHERLSRRSDWDVDDRHHSAQMSSAGRSSYSDRLVSF